MKESTLKTLIFASYSGPEVVRSSCYRKNIGAEFTHLYIPSMYVLVDHRDPPQPWPL